MSRLSRDKGKRGEEWRAVVGWGGLYSVSSLGRVRRDAPSRSGRTWMAGRILSPGLMNGYLGYTLYDGPRRRYSAHAHVLVAESFLGPRPSPGHEVNHVDFNRGNNHPSNLEWLTKAGNRAHAARAGRQRGERHPRARLNLQAIAVILFCVSRGASRRLLAGLHGVSRSTISAVLSGQNWRDR